MFFTLSIPLWAARIENGGDVQFIDDYIKIKIVVSQIEVDELPQDINLPRVLLGGHFGLSFSDFDQSQILRETDSGSGTFYKYNEPEIRKAVNYNQPDDNIWFYWTVQQVGDITLEVIENQRKLSFYALVKPNRITIPAGQEAQSVTKLTGDNPKTLEYMVYFYYKESGEGQLIEKRQEFTHNIVYAKPDAKLEITSQSNAYKGALITWTPTADGTTIDYTDSEKRAPPSEVQLWWFDEDLTSVNLKGKKIDHTDGNHTDEGVTCTYTKDPCKIECGGGEEGDKYFVSTNQDTTTQWGTSTKPYRLGQARIDNLQADRKYKVILAYRQGAQWSECKEVTPYDSVTLAEHNGAEPAELGDPRCFIVTASYDSSFANHIPIFRWARDHILLKLPYGEVFVEYYYENSPPFAEAIRQSSTLQSLMRTLLWGPAMVLYALQYLVAHPLWTLFLLCLLGGFVIMSINLLRRKTLRLSL